MVNDTVHSNWINAGVMRIVRLRVVLALLGLLVLAVAYPVSRRLDFDRRIEALFAPDDPDLVAYRELKQAFGGNVVVLMVYTDRDLASEEGISRNRLLTEEIRQLDGVADVLSTSRLNSAIEKFRPSFTTSSTPNLFRQNDPVALGFDEIFSGYTHSKDHHRAAVVSLLNPDHPAETIERLKAIASGLPSRFKDSETDDEVIGPAVIGPAVIVGEPVLVHDGLSLIQRDGDKLATVTICLLSIVLVVSLADLRFVLLTAMTILWSVVVTKALMVMIDVQLSLVSSVLTAIVTVIAVTAVLHLGVRYRSQRGRGRTPETSTIDTLSRLAPPIFWTCATDAAGFFALRVSRITPMQQFGMMIGVAAITVFVSLLLFSPMAMMLPGFSSRRVRQVRRNLGPQHRLAESIRRVCLAISSRSLARPLWSIAFVVVAGTVASLGMGRLETDTSFLNNFRIGSPITRAYGEVEANFGGAGVWDVVLDAPTELNSDFLDQVRQLEQELREIEVDGARMTKVLSIADAEAVVSRSALAKWLPASSRLSAMHAALPGFFNALLSRPNGGGRKLRIMLRSYEQLETSQKSALIAEVERIVREHTTTDRWSSSVGEKSEGRVTGYYVLMARLIGQLIGDQWRCFAASSLLVWILLVMAGRSFRLATAALLPNLLPILVVLAMVGLLGGRMNMGAAMIAAVSIGISIDGSVHVLLNYRRNRYRGHGVEKATMMAAGNVGVPVLLATAALVVGFGVLATSEFVPTATFGLLVSVTMALGTVVNLTLLPAFILMVHRRKDQAFPTVAQSFN